MSTPSLHELVQLLASANEPHRGFTGIYTEYERGAVSRRCRMWRLRDMARVEDPPGTLERVVGRRWAVLLPGDGSGPDRIERDPEEPGSPLHVIGMMLDAEDFWSRWLGGDSDLVTGTLQQVQHEGRAAWRFTAPVMKGGRPVITVDSELGIVLRAVREDLDAWFGWSEVRVLDDLDENFFEHP